MELAGFVGPTYSMRSLTASADRSINLYPEPIESGMGKSKLALVGTPGLRTLLQLDTLQGVRGLYTGGGRCLAVSGERLYEILTPVAPSTTWTYSFLGIVQNVSTPASFAFNGTQYMIVSGKTGYILNGTKLKPILPNIKSAGLPDGVSQVSFLNQYFYALVPNTRQINRSAFLDGTTWDALSFAIKESQPDNIVGILEDHGELWVFGDRSSEVWWDAGSPGIFGLVPIPNARIEMGLAAAGSLAQLDNSIFWLANDDRGNRVVARAVGYRGERISNHAVEYHLNTFQDVSDMIGWAYQEEGHSFYCLHKPSAPPNTEGTWVYDVSTNMWHERFYWDKINAQFQPHRARCHCFFANKHLVGDRTNGKIYEQNLNFYDDATDRIRRIRIAPHMSREMRWTFYSNFQLDMEIGVGIGAVDESTYGPNMYKTQSEASVGRVPIGLGG